MKQAPTTECIAQTTNKEVGYLGNKNFIRSQKYQLYLKLISILLRCLSKYKLGSLMQATDRNSGIDIDLNPFGIHFDETYHILNVSFL